MSRTTLIDYLYEPDGPTPFKCGYCKSPDTSKIQGVMGHHMKVQDFQELVDRGFQRSGKFVYRPFMKETCCPQYVLRTDVTKFRLSKQQKATIRKMKQYLVDGKGSPANLGNPHETTTDEAHVVEETIANDTDRLKETRIQKKKKTVRPGLGADPSKPPSRKAKILRREQQAKKAAEESAKLEAVEHNPLMEVENRETSEPTDPASPVTTAVAEWVGERLSLTHDPSHAHVLTTRLLPSSRRNTEFAETFDESYTVFRKFQLGVHRDNEEDCREAHFNEFLVESPLIQVPAPEGSPCNYGSYHLQYLIDGKIFAVGVLDIIPKGVLCEYLYYDPDYRFIAPGVYSALNEIELTQQFLKINPDMQYYYMGFYVQSCPKMNYKRRYASSELLCPETHTYVPLPLCIPRLKEEPYCRLNETAPVVNERDEVTEEVVEGLQVLHSMELTTYRDYRNSNGDGRQAMVKSYVQLVGPSVASRALLHIPSADMMF